MGPPILGNLHVDRMLNNNYTHNCYASITWVKDQESLAG